MNDHPWMVKLVEELGSQPHEAGAVCWLPFFAHKGLPANEFRVYVGDELRATIKLNPGDPELGIAFRAGGVRTDGFTPPMKRRP